MGVRETEKKDKTFHRKLREIMSENSPDLGNDMTIHIQDTQWTPSKISLKNKD
jgi:hypothetical protein